MLSTFGWPARSIYWVSSNLAASRAHRLAVRSAHRSLMLRKLSKDRFEMGNVFTTERRVEFCETDAAGIVHFSSFLCYMEQVEHGFLRSNGQSVILPLAEGGHLSWPRVKVECHYFSPARFEEILKISMQITRLGSKSVTYQFTFTSAEDNLIARGEVVAVCCHVMNHGESIQSIEIPEHFRTIMTPYVCSK